MRILLQSGRISNFIRYCSRVSKTFRLLRVGSPAKGSFKAHWWRGKGGGGGRGEGILTIYENQRRLATFESGCRHLNLGGDFFKRRHRVFNEFVNVATPKYRHLRMSPPQCGYVSIFRPSFPLAQIFKSRSILIHPV